MRSQIKVRICLYSVLVSLTLITIILSACGTMYATDGRSVTVLGFGHIKDQKTNLQTGWGIGSNGSSDVARQGPWDGSPSQAVSGN